MMNNSVNNNEIIWGQLNFKFLFSKPVTAIASAQSEVNFF